MPKKYKKKPVVIEAVQFTRQNLKKLELFTGGKLANVTIPRCVDGVMTAEIPTLEGIHIVTENDFVIKGVAGEFYPCKPHIFYQTYDPA